MAAWTLSSGAHSRTMRAFVPWFLSVLLWAYTLLYLFTPVRHLADAFVARFFAALPARVQSSAAGLWHFLLPDWVLRKVRPARGACTASRGSVARAQQGAAATAILGAGRAHAAADRARLCGAHCTHPPRALLKGARVVAASHLDARLWPRLRLRHDRRRRRGAEREGGQRPAVADGGAARPVGRGAGHLGRQAGALLEGRGLRRGGGAQVPEV